MTWIPCSMCHQVPCTCFRQVPYGQPVVMPFQFVPFTAPPKLTDEDVERIARRLAELLKEKP